MSTDTIRINKLTTAQACDLRAAPWTGTALGVFQAFNTYVQHEQVFRASSRAGIAGGVDETSTETDDGGRQQVGMVQTATASGATTDRLERTWLNVVKGEQAKQDTAVLQDLALVQGVKMRDMVPA